MTFRRAIKNNYVKFYEEGGGGVNSQKGTIGRQIDDIETDEQAAVIKTTGRKVRQLT